MRGDRRHPGAPPFVAAVLPVIGSLVGLLTVPDPLTAQQSQQPGELPGEQMLPGLNIPIEFDQINFVTLDDGAMVMSMSGYVDIDGSAAMGFRLQADEVRVNTSDYTFEAIGNVVFDQGEVLLRGSRMTGDLDEGTGEILDAQGIGPGDVYFRGESIRQLRPGLYEIKKGVVTPCKQALPIWEFSARTVKLEPGSHAIMTLPMFKFKGVPVLALPAVYWPIDEEGRSTGFLLPSIGSSTNRGFMFTESFFWAISRTADLTLSGEQYSKAGTGVGTEFRHAFAPGSDGRLRVYRLRGTRLTADQIAAGQQSVPGGWTVDATHQQQLPGGFRLNANANFFTSQQFVQGFEDDFNRFLRRTSSAGAYLTRSWDVYSLNLVADSNRTFFGQDSVLRQRLPEAEFRVRRKSLLGPLYLDFESSAARLVRREDAGDEETGGNYSRLDALPELSLQLSQIPWLTFSPFVSWRSTYYSHRTVRDAFEPDPILRNSYATGITIVGPSVFRIFDTPRNGYSPRFKHVLEPRVIWTRSDQLEFDGRIIQFDEIDRLGGPRHRMTVSLTSRLLAKRFGTPNAEERSVWETLSVELAREFDLDEPPDQEFPTIPLPYRLTARVTPTSGVNFSGGVEFTPTFGLGGYNISGNLNYQRGRAGITWISSARTFADPDDPTKVAVESFTRLTGGGEIDLFYSPADRRGAITLRGNTSWDVTEKELQEIAFAGQWNTQCCSIGGQFRNISFSFRDEQQFSVILELLNVGSLGFGSDRQ